MWKRLVVVFGYKLFLFEGSRPSDRDVLRWLCERPVHVGVFYLTICRVGYGGFPAHVSAVLDARLGMCSVLVLWCYQFVY